MHAPTAKGNPRAKKYGQSCLTCRRRKVRCDGGRPSCQKCVQLGERCTYSTHDSTVNRVRNALTKAEDRLHQLEQELRDLLSFDPVKCQDKLRVLAESLAEGSDVRNGRDPTESDLPNHDFNQQSTISPQIPYQRQHLSLQDNGHGMGDEEDEEVGPLESNIWLY